MIIYRKTKWTSQKTSMPVAKPTGNPRSPGGTIINCYDGLISVLAIIPESFQECIFPTMHISSCCQQFATVQPLLEIRTLKVGTSTRSSFLSFNIEFPLILEKDADIAEIIGSIFTHLPLYGDVPKGSPAFCKFSDIFFEISEKDSIIYETFHIWIFFTIS